MLTRRSRTRAPSGGGSQHQVPGRQAGAMPGQEERPCPRSGRSRTLRVREGVAMTDRNHNLEHVVVRAAEGARLAPSIHNTQPWRLRLTASSLDLHADGSRRLDVLDPRGRQLLISCGAALFNARVAIAAAGYSPLVHRLPDPNDPSLVARVAVGPPRGYLPLAALDDYIPRRHTNRRAFVADSVPLALI